MEVDRKFQRKKFKKKLVKSQEQSQAGLMQLLRWDTVNDNANSPHAEVKLFIRSACKKSLLHFKQ